MPLSSVAEIDYSEGVSSIKRKDRNRVVTIGSDLPQGVALDTASAAFRKAYGLPPGAWRRQAQTISMQSP